jgi:hypothetical protein
MAAARSYGSAHEGLVLRSEGQISAGGGSDADMLDADTSDSN